MHKRPKRIETISAFNMHFSPPSLSLLSLQEVSMATLQPGPLHPVWHSQCQLFWPMMHCPFPLHSPGQPSAREEREIDKLCDYFRFWQFWLVPIGNVTRHLKIITIITTCMPQTTKKTCQTNSWWTSIINQPKKNYYGWLLVDCYILAWIQR